jgi:hypothetical protein
MEIDVIFQAHPRAGLQAEALRHLARNDQIALRVYLGPGGGFGGEHFFHGLPQWSIHTVKRLKLIYTGSDRLTKAYVSPLAGDH